MPRVVTFSPISPGASVKPASFSSSNNSEWMRWTCRRFGRLGSRATRERCFTVSPACASPSTPRPASKRIESAGFLLKLWVGLRWTARTVGDDIYSSHYTKLPPPSWGRVGVGVVLSSEDCAELKQRPHPNPPPARGRELSSNFNQQPADLSVEKPAVHALLAADQRAVVAFLDDAAAVEDEDALERAHRRQAVRDHDGGAALHQALGRILDQRLRL